MRYLPLIIITFLSSIFFACKNKIINENSMQIDANAANAVLVDIDSLRTFDFVTARVDAIKKALSGTPPILPLIGDSTTTAQKEAEKIAMVDPTFTKYTFDSASKKAYRNEIFNIFQARQSDMGAVKTPYELKNVYRVEMYNYGLNLTSMSLVDVQQKKVLFTNYYAQTQPDIPTHLRKLAEKIAVNSKAVQDALGYTPKETEALMGSTQTSLNKTKCERSRHLCVAPTFVKGDKALWAIVDLTEHRLVGVRWTNVGQTGMPATGITERRLQDDKITACYCEKETALEKNNWKMNYMLTSSDGLRVSEVSYKGVKILNSAKLVDWHVSYSGTDAFGYSDAVGCPNFSQSAVVAISEPKLLELSNKEGFVLEQTYASQGWPTPCNYNYKQRFEFYNDGSFRVSCASLGRGCGNNGIYRPVFRIAFTEAANNIYEWQNNNWNQWATEKWTNQTETTTYNANGAMMKIVNSANQGYFLEPSKGQFGDGGRGDNAFIYATLNLPNRDEGDADLPTIGPCCNNDYRQGPEKFIENNPENIQGKSLVIWYAAQMKNDDTKGKEYCWAESYLEDGIYKTRNFPCFCGPKFIPIK
jgi:hypothetical protein